MKSRKYILLLLILSVIMGVSYLVTSNLYPPLEDAPVLSTRERTVSQATPVTMSPFVEVETSSLAYPSELYFGDTCYCQITKTNHTENSIRICEPFQTISNLGFYGRCMRFVISSEGIKEDYTIVPEMHQGKSGSGVPIDINPGASVSTSFPLELPPLEAMGHPFWKKLRNKMTPEGIKCILTIKLLDMYCLDGKELNKLILSGNPEEKSFIMVYEHEILIKPRPGREQPLLDNWLRKTPMKFLPPVSESPFVDDDKRWSTPEMIAFAGLGYRQSDNHFIKINGQKYNPWCFIRDGNRKPPAPLCPTTLEGWEKLENSLVSSTMMDEIQLTRQLIDYLGAKGNVQIQKRQALVQWLKSLPEPQSMSMVSNLADFKSIYGMYGHDELGYAAALEKPYNELLMEIRCNFPRAVPSSQNTESNGYTDKIDTYFQGMKHAWHGL